MLDTRFALHVPSYFFTEAASVLQRKVAVDHTLTEIEAFDVFRLLRSVPVLVHSTDDLLENAIKHGIRYRWSDSFRGSPMSPETHEKSRSKDFTDPARTLTWQAFQP